MPEIAPEFEQTDDLGVSLQFGGSIGATVTLIPASPSTKLDAVLVRCGSDNNQTRRLLWSFDGVTFHSLSPGEFVGWSPRALASLSPIKQIYIKSADANTVVYEIIINKALT